MFGAIELSATDATLAGEYTEADIEECAELVRKLWGSIEAAAKWEADYFNIEDDLTGT
jgi:hypothetical protein